MHDDNDMDKQETRETATTSEATELARALAARRRIETKICPICGTPFTGIAKKQYCSGRCATRAFRRGLSIPYANKSKKEADNG